MSKQKPEIFVIKHPLGIFAISQAGQFIEFHPFDKNIEKAMDEFKKEVPEKFLKNLKGFKISNDEERGNNLFRRKFRKIIEKMNIEPDALNRYLSEFSLKHSKIIMKKMFSRDKFLVQAYNAYEDLSKIQNTCLERLHEWFSLHYPELDMSYKELCKYIVKYGTRENFPDYVDSVGLDLTEQDKEIIIDYAVTINKISDQKKNLEKYIKRTIKEIAPNLSALIEELIAAKILSIAGSLKKLARMSSSNIQLIGAEKALFRHIRKKGKSPKYGVLFMSHWIQNSSSEKRGKVARILAAKLMQAVRIDFYSGRDESERLLSELKRDMDKINKIYD